MGVCASLAACLCFLVCLCLLCFEANKYDDVDIGVQNIVFSKQPIHNRNDCLWLYCEY